MRCKRITAALIRPLRILVGLGRRAPSGPSGVAPHMKDYAPAQLRNVGLFSHGGAGKTTLSEALLFRAGAITRMGAVEDGNTTMDFDPEELKRNMSVSLA